MSVTSIAKDPERLTMTITADLDATAERAWQLWSDPRQLERWWGPPTWPATFASHDFTPGGGADYYMTGPNGEKAGGWFRFIEIEPPRRLVIEDGFADDSGAPNDDLPRTVFTVRFVDRAGGVTMTIDTQFPSLEAMEQMSAMGMDEGMSLAMGQIDAILAEHPA